MATKSKENIRLFRMDKSRLRDLNIEEARGLTINYLLEIEYRINHKITEYFKPADKNKFKKIILNSSILDIGSKLKILYNLKAIENKTIDKIRKLASIRNGFAHAPITDNIIVILPSNKEKNKMSTVIETNIEVMNSNGEIKSRNAYEHLKEFWHLYKEIDQLF